jgi:RND family efflux transporter MFP subunit
MKMTKLETSNSRLGYRIVSVILFTLCAAIVGQVSSRMMASRQLEAATHELAVTPVNVTRPAASAPSSQFVLPATVQPYMATTIYARTNGYLQKWYADIGTHVRKGQLLATIASPEIDSQLEAAQATLRQVEAGLKLAQITARRYSNLSHTDAVAQQEVDQTLQNLRGQEATLQASQAEVRRLRQLQGFEKVYAPFDGVVTNRKVDVGNLINAGGSAQGLELFQLSQVETLRVFVSVPENYAAAIKGERMARVDFAQYPGQIFQGTIVRNSQSIDPATRTLLVEINVSNKDGRLLPGSYANVRFNLHQNQPSCVLPANTLLFRAEGPQVAIVKNDRFIELRNVTVGTDFGSTVQIVSGLNGTEEVVLNPPDSLLQGQRIQVIASKGN